MTEVRRAFGRFELKEKMGVGGFGEVWKAYDPQRGHDVALKVLHQGLMQDAQFLERARQEAQLVQTLDHPNIVKVFEVGEAGGRLYICMEYVDGKTLAEWTKDTVASSRPLTILQVTTIVAEVADALDAAHAKKVVHRDIKPENILIDKSGKAHLLDFGLAYAAMSSVGASRNSVPVGSFAYMAPELAAGQRGDRASDIYSLGVVAYQLVAGRLPFEEQTIAGYLTAHKDQKPPLPSKFNLGLSAHVDNAILKALQKESRRRYKTAGAFATALRKASERPYQKPGSIRWGCVAAGFLGFLLLVALAVGGSFVFGFNPLSQPTQTLAVAQLASTFTATHFSGVAVPDNATLPASGDAGETRLPEISTSTVTTEPPTRAPTDTVTLAVTLALPTETPVTPTATPTPTETPTTTAGELASLAGTGVSIETIAGSGSGSQGQLVVSLQDGLGKPIVGKYVEVHSQKQDLAGQWVRDRRLQAGNTDNTGRYVVSLSAGNYLVYTQLNGYNWGNATDGIGQSSVPVEAGKTTQLTVKISRLTVGFLRGDKTVISGQYVRVYTQKRDLAGNWVIDEAAAANNTDNTGIVSFDLAPGYYIVQSDFPGYNWGTATDVKGEASVPLRPGEEKVLTHKLGQLVVGLVDGSGQPRTGQYVSLYFQRPDVAGTPSLGDRLAGQNTDNTGQTVFNVTTGKYAVVINDLTLYNVEVASGQVTFTDGAQFEVRP